MLCFLSYNVALIITFSWVYCLHSNTTTFGESKLWKSGSPVPDSLSVRSLAIMSEQTESEPSTGLASQVEDTHSRIKYK